MIPPARYDVFLSYSHAHERAVEVIAERLRTDAGLRPFFDKWDLPAGQHWQPKLATALQNSAAVAVFIGPDGADSWHDLEIQAAIDIAVQQREDFRVIPVLLPGADKDSIDVFLRQRTWVDFAAGLDDQDALSRLAAGIRGEAFTDHRFRLPDEPAPYRGLRAFDRQDHRLFFGRGADVDRLLAKLRLSSFIAVVGPSGSGKSSLVRAGVIPRLDELTSRRSGGWDTVVATPGSDPLRSVAEQIAVLQDGGDPLGAVDTLVDRFRANDDGLLTAVRALTAGRDRSTLVVIDQFEEVFTLAAGGGGASGLEARRLVANIGRVQADGGEVIKVVVTLRADFMARAIAVPGFADLLEDHQVVLGPLLGPQLLEAIVRPAERVGALFEKGLVSRVVADLGGEPGPLPLLQHTLLELWNRRSGPWLTLDAYEAMGGVTGSIASTAEAVYSSLSRNQQVAARQILLRLVAIGDGEVADSRRRVSRRELDFSGASRDDIDAVLDALSGPEARLVVVDEDSVDVAHEALLLNWGTLQAWLQEDRESLRAHRRLTLAAAEWATELDHDPAALYRGSRLTEALALVDDRSEQLNEIEMAFVAASEARADELLHRERARSRSLRLRLIAATVALVIAVVGVGAAILAAMDAGRRTAEASSLALALQAGALEDVNPALSLALAAQAAQATDEPLSQAVDAIISARIAFADRTFNPIGLPLEAHEDWAMAVAVDPAGGAIISGGMDGTVGFWAADDGAALGSPVTTTAGVTALARTPDGSVLATGGADGFLQLWDLRARRPIGAPWAAHPESIRDVAFSADGRLLVSGGVDGSVRLWDGSTGQPVGDPLDGEDGIVSGVAISPDGSMVAAATEAGTIHRWSVDTGRAVGRPLVGHVGQVWSVDFSPDGALLASGGADGTVRVWDGVSGEPVGEPLTGHLDLVLRVVFGPQSILASGSDDDTVRLWDPVDMTPIGQPLEGHTDFVRGLGFSADGSMLVSASADGTLRRWQVGPGDPIARPFGQHEAPVRAVAFRPDGQVLATASSDGSVRLWRLESGQLLRSWPADGEGLRSIVFSPDGAWLASAGRSGQIQRWDPDDGQPIGQPLLGHGGEEVRGLVVADEGRLLASAGADGSIILWDLERDEPAVLTLPVHADGATAVALDPSGSLLAGGGADGSIWIWRVDDGDLVASIPARHDNGVWALAFSPDGRRLATGGGDGEIGIWETGTGRAVGSALLGHTDWVRGLAFSRSGAILASASADFTLRLWDTESGRPIGRPLRGHTNFVYQVAFSPDDDLLATGSQDGSVRLWPSIWSPSMACQLARPYVDPSQVRAYLPGPDVGLACDLESR